MINNHFPTVFAALVVLAATASANAQTTPTGEREFGAKMLVCNTCHGARGVPHNPTIPVIWGQQENYLAKQMHDFQSGDRNNEVMSWMSTALTPAELSAAAASFSKKSWPARPVAAASASPPGTAAVCQICHQQNFVGGPAAPRLAGQRYEYLVEAMRRFAEGERTNSADMTNIMKAMAPAEREAMARYISGL